MVSRNGGMLPGKSSIVAGIIIIIIIFMSDMIILIFYMLERSASECRGLAEVIELCLLCV